MLSAPPTAPAAGFQGVGHRDDHELGFEDGMTGLVGWLEDQQAVDGTPHGAERDRPADP
jgi:hypothetical protein